MKFDLPTRNRCASDSRVLLILVCLLAISADFVHADNGKIAFTSNRDGEWAIYIMDGDGGNPYKLTDGGLPAWLPNSEKIGYVHDGDIWVIDREGTNRRNVTKGRFEETILFPDWSPDGEEIAYWSRVGGIFGIADIYLMDADGRNPKQLTDDLHHDGRPSWSPDGRNIAFSAYLRPQGNWVESEIFVINANGGNRVNLTQNPLAKSGDVSWSPDGRRIAYSASPKPFLWFAPYNIYVMDADGSNSILITAQERWAYEWRPCWSPDSKKIAFVKQTPDGFRDIFTIDADGSNLRNMTQTHRVSEGNPAWGPPMLAVSSSGRLVTRWGDVKRRAKQHPTVK